MLIKSPFSAPLIHAEKFNQMTSSSNQNSGPESALLAVLAVLASKQFHYLAILQGVFFDWSRPEKF